MRKYLILALKLAFYISSLLFFKENILIIPAILLISYLFLENKYYSFLPLFLVFFIPNIYKYLLIITFIFHLLLIKFIRKNRFYAFVVFIVSILLVNIVLLISKTYSYNLLYISIFSIIIYAIINLFFIFNKKGINNYTISINDDLVHLTFLLGYLCLITIYNPNDYLYYMLFMQLFMINNYIYNLIFTLFSVLLYFIFYRVLNLYILNYLSTSFLPPMFLLSIDYTMLQSIYFIIYTILISLTIIKRNKISIENNYVENLFSNFNKYIDEYNIEYENLNTMKDIKANRIKTIQEAYCKYCILNTECKYNLSKRYSFLANAILNNDSNIYYCPHYSQFKMKEINNVLKPNTYKTYNDLTSEVEYLYHQGLNRIKDYNKIINELIFFGYEIIDFNLFLKYKTTYFQITITNTKKIITELFINICQRKLHEQVLIKCIEKKDYSEVYIYKKPKVKIEYSHQILAKNNNVISGDNYYIKRDYNDSYIFALSDGMGNGHKAYYESSKALDLIKRLLNYNFSFKTTLKLLENFYELKCDYDSYATLDLLFINTANMKLNLYKMGSTTTYIVHCNQIQAYENKALPFKLDDINSSYEIEYFKDDVILLLSDGIVDFISIKDLYEIDYNKSTDYILTSIINKIKQKENNELKDDASLIVIKIN